MYQGVVCLYLLWTQIEVSSVHAVGYTWPHRISARKHLFLSCVREVLHVRTTQIVVWLQYIGECNCMYVYIG